jgi:hypothetical protein
MFGIGYQPEYLIIQASGPSPPPGTTFTVLSSGGTSYSPTYVVLGSDGTAYTVVSTVLGSSGTSYAPI